jgi:hypothetical protein
MTQPYPPVIYYLEHRFQFSFESFDIPDIAHYSCTIGFSTKVRAFTREHAMQLAPVFVQDVPTIEDLEVLCKPTSI